MDINVSLLSQMAENVEGLFGNVMATRHFCKSSDTLLHSFGEVRASPRCRVWLVYLYRSRHEGKVRNG
jgi:hypothetical protein